MTKDDFNATQLAPDRIWAEMPDIFDGMGFWRDVALPSSTATSTGYVRADIHDARVAALKEALKWAHDTLWEINAQNYDHDDVCRLNDASVEVILGIAPMIGETHGKSPEWWAARAALGEAKP